MDKLAEAVTSLLQEKVFLGGPPGLFADAGRKQLMALLSAGLYPSSKVLEIGCGCLRCGHWLIHLLEPDCYFGIEPNQPMLRAGVRALVNPELMAQKRPTFNHNATFDFSVFGERFDFLVARSIWTHASKTQIKTMLDGFASYANPGAIFITSYRAPESIDEEYYGEEWVGRSHNSDTSGIVRHSLSWIQEECSKRELVAEEMTDALYSFGDQTWLKIRHIPSS